MGASTIRHYERNNLLPSVLPRFRTAALIFSLTAHFCVVLALRGGDVSTIEHSTGRTPPRILRVQLLQSDVVSEIVAESLKPATHDEKFIPPPTAGPSMAATLVPHSRGERSLFPPRFPPMPYYFLSSELTRKQIIVQDVSPIYTQSLSAMAPQSVILRLLVNERGNIDRVLIEESHLPDEVERILIEAFSKVKFDPGLIDDLPVKSQMKIEVALGMEG